MATGTQITAIEWQRVNLTLFAQLDQPPSGNVRFRLDDKKRSLPIKTEPIDDRVYCLRLNVTNLQDRKQIPNGTWRIVPYIDDEPGTAAGFDLDQLDRLQECSRAYLYANNTATYIVNFGLSEDDDPDLLMRTYQLSRPGKTSPPKNIRGRIAQRWLPHRRRVALLNVWYRLARRLRLAHKDRILFASETRDRIQGNLLRIRDRMVERGLDREFEFRYSFRTTNTITRSGTLRLTYLLATSDTVIIDDYVGLFDLLELAPETKIIQAWHAGSGFKSVGYSRFGNYGSPKLRNPHRKYTYAITGSTHLVPAYAEAFGIEESAVIPTGLPRIDTFLDTQRISRVCAEFFARYPHLNGKRLILFAPTFRGRGARTAYYDYSVIDFEKLHIMCGEDSVILFRAHHFLQSQVPIPPEYADRLLDFTSFPDVNDLLHVTDILITDYSSIIYEFSLLDRPMLFFAYDRKVYAATRGFHRDFNEMAPGKVCDTMDELVKAIENEDYEYEKVASFRHENFDRIDTGSADRFIDWLVLDSPSREVQ